MYLGGSAAVTGWERQSGCSQVHPPENCVSNRLQKFLAGGKCRRVSKSSIVSFAEKLVL